MNWRLLFQKLLGYIGLLFVWLVGLPWFKWYELAGRTPIPSISNKLILLDAWIFRRDIERCFQDEQELCGVVEMFRVGVDWAYKGGHAEAHLCWVPLTNKMECQNSLVLHNNLACVRFKAAGKDRELRRDAQMELDFAYNLFQQHSTKFSTLDRWIVNNTLKRNYQYMQSAAVRN